MCAVSLLKRKGDALVRIALKSRASRIIALILVFVLVLIIVLQIGTLISASWSAWLPDYEKEDISYLLTKPTLTDEEYELLFKQTGLTRLGIDGLIKAGLPYRIIKIQEQYFKKQSYRFRPFSAFTGFMERTEEPVTLEYAFLENGDILYSPSTFFSFFRLGHTSLVTDGKIGVMAQASGYGSKVKLLYTDVFFTRPSFIVLRIKGSEELCNAAAEYTEKNAVGKRYSLLAGIFGEKSPENLGSTHCSHFIWYAYQRLGIDLDSDGGKIVTPDDILYSPYVSVVQIYGIDPESLGLDYN